MKIITQPNLPSYQKQRALKIWNTEYPVKLQMPGTVEFDAFLNSLVNPKHFLLITDHEELAGWAALFPLGNGRSFFVMLDAAYHGKGYGTLLLNKLKRDSDTLFGWVIDHDNDFKADGTPYLSPLDFYLKNDFTIDPAYRLETDLLSAVNIKWNVFKNQTNSSLI